MSKKITAGLMAAGFALTLGACGGSGDFKAAIKEQCEKNDKTTDCACAADILDKQLDDKTKNLLLALKKGMDAGKSQADVLKDAGISADDATTLMTTAMPAMISAGEKCKKS